MKNQYKEWNVLEQNRRTKTSETDRVDTATLQTGHHYISVPQPK